MRVAMLGTRGVPAHYGGFETAIEEIGRRLVAAGHEVTVYCRGAERPRPKRYLGMDLVHLPAARAKALETLSHSALSAMHLILSRRRHDAVIVFNAANSPFLPLLHLRRTPVVVHVDGLEWRRSKWGGAGRHYYRMAESLAVRWADALIADARGIADYYTDEFGVDTELLTYGAPIQRDPAHHKLTELGLEPRAYHLAVARFEPENQIDQIVAGYRRSTSSLPLVVVGSAPYANDYTARVHAEADGDDRIHLLGGLWDQEQLDQLYANALTYMHGHSVGGTNPSLLRAMGAGTAVLAFDVVFNREVLGEDGRFFTDADSLTDLLEKAEAQPDEAEEAGDRLRDRAASEYRWSAVAEGYAGLVHRLGEGFTVRGTASGRRKRTREEHGSS